MRGYHWYDKEVPFEKLLGKVLTSIVVNSEDDDDEIVFTCADGKVYRMFHMEDCCESVTIEDIDGDIQRLLNSPILLAEEVSHSYDEDNKNEWSTEFPQKHEYDESFTWTFYKLSTNLDSVTIRWYGTSNGYYSERVGLYLEN